MQQIIRPGGFFLVFRILIYIPYIAIGLLVAAIAIWVIFSIKKYRWAKILAIVLTVIVVFTGLLSLAPYFLGRPRGRFSQDFPQDFPQDREQIRGFQDSGLELNIYDYAADFKFTG